MRASMASRPPSAAKGSTSAAGSTISSSMFFVRRWVAMSNSPIASISVSKNSTRTGAPIGE